VKISCPNCSAAYELDDARVPPVGLSIKCPKCKKAFTVKKQKAGEAAAGAKTGAVPLPGQAGATPAAAPRTVPPKFVRKPAGGAVPLPGLGDGPPSAIEPALPPLDAPQRTGGDVPVPLPGLDDLPPSPGMPAAKKGADPFASIEMGAPPSDTVVDDDSFAIDLKPEDKHKPARPAGPSKPSSSAPDDGGLNFDFVAAPQPPKKPAGTAPGAGAEMLDFVDEEPKAKEKPKRGAPPVIARGAAASKEETLSLEAEPKDSRKAEKERRKKENRAEDERRKAIRGPGAFEALTRPWVVVVAVLVAALAVGGVLGYRARLTPAGLFWVNKYMPSKKAATAAEAKVIARGLEKLGEGDFAGAREAVGTAAQLLAVLPDDDDVKAFFVLSASELKLAYGQLGGDWDQAKRVVEKMKSNKLPQNRARGAFALANGELAKGKQLLAPLGDSPNADLESVWLYAESLLRANESVKAAQVLDNALKKQAPSKLLLQRGLVSKQQGQFADAAGFFDKALQKSSDNGRALVELSEATLRQGDNKRTGELLTRALETDVRKSLDAGEEARANMLKGKLAAASHEPKAAEAAYERAVAMDPASAELRESYGEFRLSRREWDKAARQFDSAITSGTASAVAYAGAALAYLGTNRLLEADKRINEAVLKDPTNPHYLYLQGRVAEAIGKAEEAFKRYEAALQKKPDLTEALVAEGMVFASRAEKPKAKEKLEAALKTPEAGRTSLEEEGIGDLALAIGDKDGARAAFKRALQKAPDDPLAHSGMGRALAASGDLRGAHKELETARAQLDGDAPLEYEYGSLLRRMGESDTALESLRKSVKIDSKDPRYRARLGALLVERGQYEEAEAQLREAAMMDPRFGEAQFFLARALAGRRNLSEAISTMKKAVEIDPDNSDYLYHLGLIYEQGQQVQDAAESFQKAIGTNPKHADAHEHLGRNLMVENRFDEAVAAFKRAAELDPRRARLWAEVGDAEQQSGDLDSAIRDFQKALAQDANLTGVWTKLGIAYKDKDCKGCRSKALDALKRAAHVDPADATAHHELGYMYKDDGRRREAIAEFKRYLELRPDAGDISSVQDDIYYLTEETRRTP